jgi:hypothetical protein
MLTLMILVLAVNGGMYLGTIAYSAWKSAEVGKAIDLFVGFRPFSIN